MTLDPFRGTLRWTPRADQLGEVEVEIGLFDTLGARSVQLILDHLI